MSKKIKIENSTGFETIITFKKESTVSILLLKKRGEIDVSVLNYEETPQGDYGRGYIFYPDTVVRAVKDNEEKNKALIEHTHTQTIKSVRERIKKMKADNTTPISANNLYSVYNLALDDLLKDLEAPTHPTSEISD
jgi:hypothetical protein